MDVHMKIVINQKTDILTQLSEGKKINQINVILFK